MLPWPMSASLLPIPTVEAEANLEILELLAPDTVCGDVSAASQLDLDMINVHGGTQATVDSVRTQSMSQGQG